MTDAAVARMHMESVERAPQRDHAPSRDRHLRALPAPSVRRAPRLVHGVLALAGLAGIVVAQLGLSVVISEGAYTLSALQGESSALARSEQALAEDVAVLSSPQHVSIAADELGMLAGQPSQFLTLSGEATAGGPDALHMQVPALDQFGMYVPNALLNTQPQTAAVVHDVAEAAVQPYPGMLLAAGETAPQVGSGADAADAEAADAAAAAAAAAGVAPTTDETAPGTLLPATAAE
ncbi:hypothetical protein [Agrococcus sp. ARC_14]|uniref:hypothetical protein n=1 Tax=Agrococcus sp. ARC_14 TaxID=2919927 RepID=UPI001F070795|nr:hypothetical protein [Agrococcus sp. ARC_14]MCH1883478.1 hypothetical protein [Agrococcus sp. ARC_14]